MQPGLPGWVFQLFSIGCKEGRKTKKEAERKPFRRAKAVVKTMDKLLEGDDIAYSWKRRFEDISSGAQASARRKAAMLLHQIAARGEYCIFLRSHTE